MTWRIGRRLFGETPGLIAAAIVAVYDAGEIDGLAAWDEMMGESEIARKIDADQEANGPAFFAML